MYKGIVDIANILNKIKVWQRQVSTIISLMGHRCQPRQARSSQGERPREDNAIGEQYLGYIAFGIQEQRQQYHLIVLPDACCKLGIMRRLSLLGPNLADLGCPVAETGELLDACQHYSVIHCLLH